MCVAFFPFFYYFSKVCISQLLIRGKILQWIWTMFGKEEIDDSSHEDVENKNIRVCIFKNHQRSSKKNPYNNHKRYHRNNFFYHPHIGARLFIFMKHGQRIPIEIKLCIKVQKPKEMYQWI